MCITCIASLIFNSLFIILSKTFLLSSPSKPLISLHNLCELRKLPFPLIPLKIKKLEQIKRNIVTPHLFLIKKLNVQARYNEIFYNCRTCYQNDLSIALLKKYLKQEGCRKRSRLKQSFWL